MPLTQKNRDIAVTTPLGPDALVLRRMVGTEGLSRLFEFELDLISDNPNIDPRQLLGQAASVRLTTQNNQPRYFHGQVARFILTSHSTTQDQARYRATLRPWFWLLTRTTDCRIFQDKTVPDIIQQILGEYGYSTYLDNSRLHGDYRTWEYCVQYRETDFDFLSRLMEQEGIYYYFEHQADRHNLVLADGYPAHGPAPGYETIPYYPPANEIRRQRQHIHRWDLIQEVQPGRYTLKDYDHHKPRDPLLADHEDPRGHAADDFEIYDYPGEYLTTAEGKNYARIRLEEREAEFEVAHARANAAGLSSGFLFTLAEHPRADQNRQYLVTAANHTLSNDEFEAGGKGETDYHCRFQAIDARTQYRPPRRTPRPVVQGIQTAIVTGKPGEEIWTDKQGRVKVQFHWDREGKRNEHTSCWIRVAQLMAGGSWGAIFIPRIGQEVIVEFLEGDPDRPLITGGVYNGDSPPPYGLPGKQNQTGFKSNSTKGGGGSNELRFDDTKGAEELFMNSQWNTNIATGNDKTESVTANLKETIGGNKRINLAGNHNETIGGNRKQRINGNSNTTISGFEMKNIMIASMESVGAAKMLTIGAGFQESVGLLKNVSVGYSYYEQTGTTRSLIAGEKIELTCGASSITLESSGKVTIKGSDFFFEASGPVKINGSVIDLN